jgi:hypothetical protein
MDSWQRGGERASLLLDKKAFHVSFWRSINKKRLKEMRCMNNPDWLSSALPPELL